MEIQQFKAKKRVVERTVSKYGVSSKSEHSLIKMQSMLSGKNLPAKYMYENVIKDGVVLREVCVQQAIILISQVYILTPYLHALVDYHFLIRESIRMHMNF